MKERGFSLIESLIALSLLGIIVAAAALPFVKTSPKYSLIKAVREIHSRLNFARYKSIYLGTKVRLRMDSDSYQIEIWDNTSATWRPEPKRYLGQAAIEANNTPTFHPVGTVSNLCTIHVKNSWGYYRISLAISGRVKVTRVEPPT